jgi:hypothetical protein
MAEEEKKNVAVATPAAATTAPEMKTQAADANQFRQAFEARKQGAQNNINSTLGSSLNTQKQGLADAYNRNVTAQDQATTTGQQAFDFAKEDLGVQAGRTQRGMDSYADVRGLNRQAGSQQALSLGLGASTAAGRLAQQQQMAAQESQRQKELLSTDYHNRVQKAIAGHDYKQAAALLDDYNNQNSWLDKNAAAIAAFGNFSGYEELYGQPQADSMRQFWIGSNPELAYNTGVIDGERYKAITGRDAPDYVPPVSAGGGSGGNLGEMWWYLPEAHVQRGYGCGGNTSGGG